MGSPRLDSNQAAAAIAPAARSRSATRSGPMSATSGASSGPWVRPVSAARSGMNSPAPRRPVAAPTARVQARKSARARRPRRGRVLEEPRAGRGDLARRVAVGRDLRIADHGDQRVGVRRKQQVAAHRGDEREPPLPAAEAVEARREPRREVRLRRPSHGFALPVPQLRLVEMRGGSARAAEVEVGGHGVGLEPATRARTRGRAARGNCAVRPAGSPVAAGRAGSPHRRAWTAGPRPARAAAAGDRSAARAARAPRAAGSAAACWRGDRHRAARPSRPWPRRRARCRGRKPRCRRRGGSRSRRCRRSRTAAARGSGRRTR